MSAMEPAFISGSSFLFMIRHFKTLIKALYKSLRVKSKFYHFLKLGRLRSGCFLNINKKNARE